MLVQKSVQQNFQNIPSVHLKFDLNADGGFISHRARSEFVLSFRREPGAVNLGVCLKQQQPPRVCRSHLWAGEGGRIKSRADQSLQLLCLNPVLPRAPLLLGADKRRKEDPELDVLQRHLTDPSPWQTGPEAAQQDAAAAWRYAENWRNELFFNVP